MKNSKLFIAILAIVAVATALLWLKSRPASSAIEPPPASSPEAAPVTTAVIRRATWDDLKSWLETGQSAWSEEDLVEAFLALDESARRALYEKLMDTCRADPDALLPFMTKLADAWGRKDPGAAMIFFTGVHDVRGIIPLERGIMNGWVERDFTGAGNYLQQISQEHAINPVAQLAFMTAVTQNEHKEKFGDYLNWVDSLKGPENRLAQTAAIEALTKLGQPENFRQIADLLENNLENSSAAAGLAMMLAQRAATHPEEAIREVERLGSKNSAHGPMLLDLLFGALGHAHPELAVKLINEGFTDKFLSPLAADLSVRDGKAGVTKEQLRDMALDRFLYSFGGDNPEYVLTVAQHFYNPKLRALYENTARREIEHLEAHAHAAQH